MSRIVYPRLNKKMFRKGPNRGGPNMPIQLAVVFGFWLVAKRTIRQNRKN